VIVGVSGRGRKKKDERKEKRRREGGENPYQNTSISNRRGGKSGALGSEVNPDLQKIVQPLHRDIVTSHTEDLRKRGGLDRVWALKSYYGPQVGPVGVSPFLGVSPLFSGAGSEDNPDFDNANSAPR